MRTRPGPGRGGRSSAVLGAVLAVGLLAAGCGSNHAKTGQGVPDAGTIPHGTVVLPPTAPPTTGSSSGAATAPPATTPTTVAGETTGTVAVPGSGQYRIALSPVAGSGPCVSPGLGGSSYGFAVSVSNDGDASEPLARVGLVVTKSSAASGGSEVVAIRYSGLCINFTEPGGTLAAGQTVTYQGSVSGVTGPSVLTANVISTPANNPLGTVSLNIG